MRTSLSIDQLTNQFLSEQSINDLSKKRYYSSLTNFWRWCAVNRKDMHGITTADLQEYRNHVISAYSVKYSTALIVIVKRFYSFIESKKYGDNFAAPLKLPKMSNEFTKEPLNEGQVLSLLGLFDRISLKSKRDYLIIRLMLVAGLRCVEVSRMNMGDIQQYRGASVIWIQRKGHTDKKDFIEISKLWNDINDYITAVKDIGPDPPMFFSLSSNNANQRISAAGIGTIITGYFKTAGIKSSNISPHSLRHTAAVTCIENSITIDDIQLFLGHTKSEITKLYTRHANKDIKLKNKTGKFLADYWDNLKVVK